MAFKMRSPIIKGTKLHKDSIAKAKSNSIVAQTRTSADPSLVTMGDIVGKSKNIGEIDYSLDTGFTGGERRDKAKKESGIETLDNRHLTDYGTYQEYVDSHNADKAKMSDKDAEAYGDPISEDEWYSKEEHKDVKRPKKEKEEIISIKPQKVRSLPTNSNLVNLQRSTNTAKSVEFKDKFEEAAKRAGFPLETLEDYESAERALVYDEKLDDWREREGYVTVGDLESKVDNRTEKQIARAEQDNIFEDKLNIGTQYGLGPEDMISDGKGSYMPKPGTKHPRYGDTWGDVGDGTMGWLDDGKEQYYTHDGKKISKETSDKLVERRNKEIEIEKKNELIREKNALIKEAKEFYGPNVKLTQTKLDEYKEIKNSEEEFLEIEEEDSPDPELEAYIAKNPDLQVKTDEKPAIIKPKPTDFKDRPNPFGGTESRNDQYRKALKKYYKSLESQEKTSSMQKRDDRIYKNAIKGGVLRKNMIDNGYIIPSKRN